MDNMNCCSSHEESGHSQAGTEGGGDGAVDSPTFPSSFLATRLPPPPPPLQHHHHHRHCHPQHLKQLPPLPQRQVEDKPQQQGTRIPRMLPTPHHSKPPLPPPRHHHPCSPLISATSPSLPSSSLRSPSFAASSTSSPVLSSITSITTPTTTTAASIRSLLPSSSSFSSSSRASVPNPTSPSFALSSSPSPYAPFSSTSSSPASFAPAPPPRKRAATAPPPPPRPPRSPLPQAVCVDDRAQAIDSRALHDLNSALHGRPGDLDPTSSLQTRTEPDWRDDEPMADDPDPCGGTSGGGGGVDPLSTLSSSLSTMACSSSPSTTDQHRDPRRLPLLLLDVYCVDVSSSMWFSPRGGPLGIFGKSKLDAAKEIMAPSDSNLRNKHEQQSQRLEKEMPHYYISKRKICLIKFHEKVKMLVPIGDEDKQREVFRDQLRTLKHKKHTALMAALEFCEEEIQKWLSLKLTPEEQKMEKDVILHLFTDGHDTVADKQRRAQWKGYVNEQSKKKLYRTFLYTFSQDFTKSKDVAKWLSEIGSETQLIVVDTTHPERAIDESWQQRDKMLFTLLRSKPPPNPRGPLARKPSKRFRIGKYNYIANVDGEHNIGLDWTLEYLKKLEIVFQQENFYQCPNIFRSEGDLSIVTEVDKEFLDGKTSLESLERPLEVASATKRILRRSEPFIPVELQPDLIQLLLQPLPVLEKGVAMANLLRDLPTENKRCLRILFSILHTVAANAEHSLMPSGYLAIPFAPIIFKGKLATLSNLEQLKSKDPIHAVAYLIDNFPVFYKLLE